jgi:Extensin-like protein C-terminus
MSFDIDMQPLHPRLRSKVATVEKVQVAWLSANVAIRVHAIDGDWKPSIHRDATLHYFDAPYLLARGGRRCRCSGIWNLGPARKFIMEAAEPSSQDAPRGFRPIGDGQHGCKMLRRSQGKDRRTTSDYACSIFNNFLFQCFSRGLGILVVFLAVTCPQAGVQSLPLPRERPAIVPSDQSASPKSNVEPSACQLRLAELAEFKPAPAITGPGECSANDVVTLQAVLLLDRQRVVLSPGAILRCTMAEAVAQWVRSDIAPAIAELSAPLRGIEALDSYSCRTFNGISGAKMSEHGRANALDLHSFKLANGAIIELTNASVSKSLREKIKSAACLRFSTVLGNGADVYHESHVHIDLMERANNYKICQWNVLER